VLAGSPYTVTDGGIISNGEHGWHGRHYNVIGAMFDIRVEEPHGFDVTVPASAGTWPRRSPNHRYSRYLGYVPYKARMAASKGVTGLLVDVDMRIRRITSISEGFSAVDVWEPLPGHCPLPPEPPDD
jgi:hypothetical protein